MSPTTLVSTSTSISGQFSAQSLCTPRCSLVIDSHLRGRTSRSVALGDIRKTQTSLMAPFHTIIDAASQRSKENRRPQPSSTLGSRSRVASSISPSARSALTSRVSTSDGGKVRPCVVIGMNGTNARVCLMGTFEGLFIDRLPAEVQQRVAVMYSPTCKHKGGWLQRPNIAHMHSIPDWHHDEGKVQYIVSLVHDIGLHDVGKRWVVKTPTARPGEGYYMDMDNSSELRTSAGELSADLQRRCGDRKYRTHMRQVLKEFKRSSKSSKSARHRTTRSVSSAASQVALSVISESGTFSSATETIASAGRRATDSCSWRSGMSGADILETHERSSILDSRNTTTAGKRDPEASSIRSVRSLLSRPLFSSPLAKHSQSSVASRQT